MTKELFDKLIEEVRKQIDEFSKDFDNDTPYLNYLRGRLDTLLELKDLAL